MKKVLTRLGFILFGLFLGILLVELFSAAVVFLYSSYQDLSNQHSFNKKHQVTILALGESTTQGGGEGSWPRQLEKILNQKDLGYSFSVINEGHSSITTDVILNNLPGYLNKYRPDIVVSMIGINDKGSVKAVSPQDTSIRTKPLWENLHFVKLIKYLLTLLSTEVEASDSQSLLNLTHDLSVEQKYGMVQKIINQFPSIPQNKEQYIIRRDYYRTLHQNQEFVDLIKKAVEVWPNDYAIYLDLGEAYLTINSPQDALKAFEQAIKLNTTDPNIYKALGRLYRENFKDYQKSDQYFQAAIDLLKGELGRNPKDIRLLSNLEEVYRLQNSSLPADQISRNILGINYATATNYQILRDTLKLRGIKLIAVQYPMRNVGLLREILENDPEVSYVDNEEIFKKAVEKDGYDKYFIDRFGGDFGHANNQGYFLLATNIAETIEKLFLESPRP